MTDAFTTGHQLRLLQKQMDDSDAWVDCRVPNGADTIDELASALKTAKCVGVFRVFSTGDKITHITVEPFQSFTATIVEQ